MTDGLSPNEIAAHLPRQLSGISITVLESTDSTNTRLRRLAEQGAPHLSLLCAMEQTAGRGRHGRDFHSPKGGVYMSVLLRSYPDELPLTIYAAAAVRRVLASLTDDRALIKWVNDIFVDRLKVCGVLAEAIPGGAIIGIGVNLSRDGLPSELDGIAGAISTDRTRAAIIADITARLVEVLALDPGEVIDEYRRYSLLPGREIHFDLGGAKSGIVTGISQSGGLLVSCPDGNYELRSGEVSVRF